MTPKLGSETQVPELRPSSSVSPLLLCEPSLSCLGNEALWDDLAAWVSILVSHVLDLQPVLSSAEYDALESPSEAFRKVTSEDILKMIEENRYSWADGVWVSHNGKKPVRYKARVCGYHAEAAP